MTCVKGKRRPIRIVRLDQLKPVWPEYTPDEVKEACAECPDKQLRTLNPSGAPYCLAMNGCHPWTRWREVCEKGCSRGYWQRA